MYRILLVDSGTIDRSVMKDSLERELGSFVEVFQAGNIDEANEFMEHCLPNLMVVETPPHSAYLKQLVKTAHMKNPNMHLILTSVKSATQTARLATQVKVTDYLLKPFRRDQLIQLVLPSVEQVKRDLERAAAADGKEIARFLEGLDGAIKDCQYKKCIEISKECIDFVHHSSDNLSVVRSHVLEMADHLTEVGKTRSPGVALSLSRCLKRFTGRYDQQGDRFGAAAVLEEMIDLIFTELEQEQMYSDDDLKKVLNYTDRNIKKGVTLDKAAEYVNMSSSYFSKFFKKLTGVNFITYVIDRKIEFAKDMLQNTDMPIINIAYELSYNETNYFSKAFKKKVGVTPSEYRESCGSVAVAVAEV